VRRTGTVFRADSYAGDNHIEIRLDPEKPESVNENRLQTDIEVYGEERWQASLLQRA
jgi:hypothetical protein